MEETKEFEAPTNFFFWSALAAFSSVVKDNVYIKMKKGVFVYPNIYVLLYAPSGLGKGMPINLAKKLSGLGENNRTITGRFTVQALLTKLSQPLY